MVLNIFPRRQTTAAPAIEPEKALPEPSPEVLEPKPAARRGTRGGRGRRKPGEAAATTTAKAEPATAELAPVKESAEEKPKPAPRRRAAAAKEAAPEEKPEPEAKPAARTRRGRGEKAAETPAAPAQAPSTPATMGDLSPLLKAIEAQAKQLEQLVRAQEELARKIPAAGGSMTAVARVGVFVDAANIELACDRLRARINWKKLLDYLTDGRQLVRAIAYSPVHDDPGVSLETQRFAEPFMDRGFRVVTKPLKRFADGSIKANVDIEMTLDIMEMLDRLDVVILASGDGDFQRLVEVVQSRGVRVEVVSVGTSTASQLRNAADKFIDIQGILQRVKA
jgi:uncharacterized LabA/DUF88 family protein